MRSTCPLFLRLFLSPLLLIFLAVFSDCGSPSSIQREKVTTSVDGLNQHATIFSLPKALPQARQPEVQGFATAFAPDSATAVPAKEKRPAVILLHPGFSGDGAETTWFAEMLAHKGAVVIVPSYRGEKRSLDGMRSDGKIEFCSGEVDDAQSALEALRARPDIDPDRIGVFGASHGGCIALRLALREPQLRAVATFSAPVAAEPLIRYVKSHPQGLFFFNYFLAHSLQKYIQGSPDEAIEQYTARSPLYGAFRLSMPIMIVHGSSDNVVPMQNACWLAQVLKQSGRTVKERWLGRGGKEIAQPQKRCALEAIQAEPILDAPKTELWLMRGQDHIYSSSATKEAAYQKVLDFFMNELGIGKN